MSATHELHRINTDPKGTGSPLTVAEVRTSNTAHPFTTFSTVTLMADDMREIAAIVLRRFQVAMGEEA